MSEVRRNARVIFEEALDCATPSEQEAYLDRACGDDSALRGRVEALLRAHQRAGHFLEGAPAPAERGQPEAPGTVLDQYRLLEPLGEGGFGIVYRAEQQQPVRRQVALKVLKPGMAGAQVVARFEAERQALALMDHPNIARVLDAGEVPPAYAGGPPRPYFVMELVEGAPLTDFCNQQRLTLRERLGLFMSVCQGVQHAHQKGIIHRDLKPSNLLVALVDGHAVVKIIDFGVAKALQQRLTDKTLVTAVAQVIGTPLYMSPEQAEPGVVDIDTRSDIYALGVLLYELLTGTTPFDRERLSKASFDELRRIIREEEPPRPSARLSTLGPAAVTLSEQRRTDPRQLGQLLRGELDWVATKCLEKQRSRRYETAEALARDVGRYLADEPVEACPPSASYRLGKFLRKHRRPLLMAAAFLVLLAAAGVLAGGQVVREARAERSRAVEQAKREGDVRDALERARALREEARKEGDPGKWKWARAREQVQRALTLVESGPAEEALVDQVRQVQEELEEEQKERRFVADLEAAHLAQADTLGIPGRFAPERAIPLYRKAFHVYGLPVGEGDPAAAAAHLLRRPLEVRQAVSDALDEWLDLAAEPSYQVREPHLDWLRTLAAAELDLGLREMRAAWQERDPTQRRVALERLAAAVDVRRLPPRALTRLARRLQAAAATGSAEQLLRRAWQQYPADFWVNEDLGLLLDNSKPPRWAEAVPYLTAAVALRQESAGALLNLGQGLGSGGQRDEEIACYQKALALDPKYASAHLNLGLALFRKGQFGEAIASFKKAVGCDPQYASAHYNLAVALRDTGRVDEAVASFRQAVALDPNFVAAHSNLGDALARQGRADEAIACFRQAAAIHPKSALLYSNLSVVLCERKKDYDGAIAYSWKAIKLDPKDAEAHVILGRALYGKGQVNKAIECYHKAIALDPKFARAHANLGAVLLNEGQMDEAVASFRQAITLDPKHAEAHANLGSALSRQGRADEAIACLRHALALDPKHANAHNSLGAALHRKGQVDEAIASFRQAIALDPKDAEVHSNLGSALYSKGQAEKAIASFRQAIALDPKRANACSGLGFALDAVGKQKEAIEAWRTAVRLEPRLAMTHYWLGKALLLQGRPGEALVSLNESAKRLPAAHVQALGLPAERSRAERLSRLEKRLPDLLAGKDRPGDNPERLDLTELCRGQQRFTAAARFYAEVFAADPKLADDFGATHRYNAACSAALAAAGAGEDAGKLDAGERARLRKQALEWLRADLTLRGKQFDSSQPTARTDVQMKLRIWQQDRALAGIRESSALDKLPAAEQKAFAQLWSDVAALLAKTAAAAK